MPLPAGAGRYGVPSSAREGSATGQMPHTTSPPSARGPACCVAAAGYLWRPLPTAGFEDSLPFS